MAIDTSSVPAGVEVLTRQTGIIQTADENIRAVMTEYSYYPEEGGYPIILGYTTEFFKNGEVLASTDTLTQSDAIELSRNYVDNGVLPE